MIFLSNCRICHSKKLVEIGSLGNIAISNFTDKPEEGIKSPLTLVYCKECTLLQLGTTVPRDLLYKHYWYQSGLNPVVVEDLKEIAKLCKGDSHIDIGGNDGTLLRYSEARYKCSIDPSNIRPDGFAWVQDYWENIRNLSGQEVDTITAIACLYDLPDPNSFIINVKDSLKPDGLFISQFQPLAQMIELNDVGNICHEHIEYYSYKSLVKLFEQNGLEIFKVDKNKMNGGSYRIFARHYKKGSIKFKEKEYGVKELKDFFKRIGMNKFNFLKQMNASLSYHKIYGYGASTKANTILQYYDTSKFFQYNIPAIIDINPNKNGKYTISTKIPIIDKIPKDCEYLWVFPYGFLDYFKKKEKGYAGKWITTIPEFKIS